VALISTPLRFVALLSTPLLASWLGVAALFALVSGLSGAPEQSFAML